MALHWKPITELDNVVRPLFLFSPSDHGNVPHGLVWVSGGRRMYIDGTALPNGGFRGDQHHDKPTFFAEIEGPFA